MRSRGPQVCSKGKVLNLRAGRFTSDALVRDRVRDAATRSCALPDGRQLMAKSKSDLMKDAQTAGLVPTDAAEDDYTAAQLSGLLSTDKPAWEGSLSSSVPLVAPDGHVVLSQEDIDARNA